MQKKKWLEWIGIGLGVLIVMYAMIYFELRHRAKSECKRGEKYYEYFLHPENKKTELDEKKAKAKIDENEYKRLMEQDDYKQAVMEGWQVVGDFYYQPPTKWFYLSEKRTFETANERYDKKDNFHALIGYRGVLESFNERHNGTIVKNADTKKMIEDRITELEKILYK